MKNLRLSLKSKWFEMTKAGIKTEDYREINVYWLSRFIMVRGEMYYDELEEICFEIKRGIMTPNECFKWADIEFRTWDRNIMTLGYPKSTDTSRILTIEHNGIEIRTGNPEWGAETGKLYFVIKHGKIIEP